MLWTGGAWVLIPPLFLFIIVSSLGGYLPAIAGTNQDIRTLREENRLLEAELKLAQKGVSYIILDPSIKKIYLKSRGILLREFQIARIRYWRERGLAIEPIPLVKKRAIFKPKRKEIKPLRPEEDASTELDFLELKDMPSRYTLLFEKGLSISVIAKPEGLISRFVASIDFILRHIRNSFIVVWNNLGGKNFAIIDLVMGEEDAQTLFWALQERTNIVIYDNLNW